MKAILNCSKTLVTIVGFVVEIETGGTQILAPVLQLDLNFDKNDIGVSLKVCVSVGGGGILS